MWHRRNDPRLTQSRLTQSARRDIDRGTSDRVFGVGFGLGLGLGLWSVGMGGRGRATRHVVVVIAPVSRLVPDSDSGTFTRCKPQQSLLPPIHNGFSQFPHFLAPRQLRRDHYTKRCMTDPEASNSYTGLAHRLACSLPVNVTLFYLYSTLVPQPFPWTIHCCDVVSSLLHAIFYARLSPTS